jgi:hypothetical protein
MTQAPPGEDYSASPPRAHMGVSVTAQTNDAIGNSRMLGQTA